jgi:hypothetical protein
MPNSIKSASALLALALAPHFSSLEFLVVVDVILVWMAPDWLAKLLRLAKEFRSFRATLKSH